MIKWTFYSSDLWLKSLKYWTSEWLASEISVIQCCFLYIVSGNPCKTEQSSFIVRKLSTFRQKIMWILYFREIHRNWDIRHDFILAILLWHNHTCEHSYIVLVYFLYLSPLLTQYFNFCSFQIERMENRFVFIWTIFFSDSVWEKIGIYSQSLTWICLNKVLNKQCTFW